MKIEWRAVEGTQAGKPSVIDRTSSSKYVYLRRNITSVSKTDENGNTVPVWVYEEAKVTQEEYAPYDNIVTELVQAELADLEAAQAESNASMRADIEYIAMMADIDLEG